MLTAAMTSRSMRRVGSFGQLIPLGLPPARVCDHRSVIPLFLLVAGGCALAAGWWLLRGMGPGARVGRILAATRVVSVGEAVAAASGMQPRYLGVTGRVDSSEEWEDEDHRPLVLRRRRLELRRADRWEAFEDVREVVPFEISEGLDRIAVDGDALDAGLVMVPRESVGTAADLGDRVPEGTDPGTPARLRLDLVTSVDHALVLGVPSLDPVRGPILRPGLNRPLILTNLEAAEAMRLLADGRQGRTRAISLLLGGGVAAVLGGLVWALVDALL